MELFSLKTEHIRVTATEHVRLFSQAIMYVGLSVTDVFILTSTILNLHLFAAIIKLDSPPPPNRVHFM
jgi:hypothetical protein